MRKFCVGNLWLNGLKSKKHSNKFKELLLIFCALSNGEGRKNSVFSKILYYWNGTNHYRHIEWSRYSVDNL